MRHKLIFSIKYTLLILTSCLFFFYIYHKGLGLDFSIKTMIFIALFLVDLIILMHLLKSRVLGAIFLSLSLIVFTFYSLVNFAYYEVFNSFLRIRQEQVAQVNKPLIELLGNYYILIPTYLYGLALILLLGIIAGTVVYCKKHKKISVEYEIANLRKLYNKINFVGLKRKNRISLSFISLLILFIIINSMLYFGIYNYKKQASAEGFTRVRYFSDLGVPGYLISGLTGNIAGSVKYKENTPLETPSKPADIKSIIDTLKENITELSWLSNLEKTPGIELEKTVNPPHIIIYQLESVGSWALEQQPTPMPYLSELINETASVEHFFANSCTTINAEFTSMCSFYSETWGPVSDLFSQNEYYCLPQLLREKHNYKTALHHANSANFWNRNILGPKWGFEDMYFSPHYENREDDGSLLKNTVSQLKKSERPMLQYVIGFSTHGPHNQAFMDNYFSTNKSRIKPYELELNDNAKTATQDEETTRIYFGFLQKADMAIKNLFKDLEENNLLDKTIVIIYGDHRYYDFKSDDKINDFYNYNKVPFAMHIPQKYRGQVKKIASHVDIAPTLLNIVEGEGYEMPEHFVGSSLFSSSHPNSAINKCLGESYYVDQNIIINNDMLLGVESPIAFLREYAKDKFDKYASLFRQVLKKSDEIMVENILLGDYRTKSNRLQTSDVKKEMKIDFVQETDSDQDGLSDLREKAIGTNRKNPDTDGDGILDGIEVIEGSDPLWPGRL